MFIVDNLFSFYIVV